MINSVNPEPNTSSATESAPLSRRDMLLQSVMGLAAAGMGGASIYLQATKDTSVSVDELVTDKDFKAHPYREVSCIGLASSAGVQHVTVWAGGYPMSSTAAMAGAYSPATEIREEHPVYMLQGSSEDIQIALVRNVDGVRGGASFWGKSGLEERLDAGEQVIIKVKGNATIRDGRRVILFDSISEISPLTENPPK